MAFRSAQNVGGQVLLLAVPRHMEPFREEILQHGSHLVFCRGWWKCGGDVEHVDVQPVGSADFLTVLKAFSTSDSK